tara:strand:+ start:71016 stop:71327 length:312 start_codon:yes stop_codon:yes gene_type:complete
MKIVDNFYSFLEARELGEKSFPEVERNTYKFTNCGAWIKETTKGVVVGSIIEGSDACCEEIVLEYPFNIKEFWQALDQIENEADELWREANGLFQRDSDGCIL